MNKKDYKSVTIADIYGKQRPAWCKVSEKQWEGVAKVTLGEFVTNGYSLAGVGRKVYRVMTTKLCEDGHYDRRSIK